MITSRFYTLILESQQFINDQRTNLKSIYLLNLHPLK